MDAQKIFTGLRQERERLEAAVLALERVEARQRRRGRPPKWLAELKSGVEHQSSRPKRESPETAGD